MVLKKVDFTGRTKNYCVSASIQIAVLPGSGLFFPLSTNLEVINFNLRQNVMVKVAMNDIGWCYDFAGEITIKADNLVLACEKYFFL